MSESYKTAPLSRRTTGGMKTSSDCSASRIAPALMIIGMIAAVAAATVPRSQPDARDATEVAATAPSAVPDRAESRSTRR